MHSPTTQIVKRLRERGLSQIDIQRRTGVPQPRLSRWENGKAPEAADDVLKLQALLAELEAADGTGDDGTGGEVQPEGADAPRH